MSCVDTGPFEGGVYNNPQINNPKVTDGTFTNATLDGDVKLTSTSAKALLEGIQEVSPTAVTDNALDSDGTDLPTVIVGEDRTVVLGKPFKWIKCGDGMIPVFRKE